MDIPDLGFAPALISRKSDGCMTWLTLQRQRDDKPDRGSSTGRRLHREAPLDERQPLAQVHQTVSRPPQAVSRVVPGALHTATVIRDAELNFPRARFDGKRHTRGAGMFRNVVQRFLHGEKNMVPYLGREPTI